MDQDALPPPAAPSDASEPATPSPQPSSSASEAQSPAPAPLPHAAPGRASVPTDPGVRVERARWARLGVGVAGVGLALAVGFLAGRKSPGDAAPTSQTEQGAASEAAVVSVHRVGPGPAVVSVESSQGASEHGPDAKLPRDAKVSTDKATRARFSLPRAAVALDQSSTVKLVREGIELHKGDTFVDVHSAPGQSAFSASTPHGKVTSEAGKLSLWTGAGRSGVRVMQGTAEVATSEGQRVIRAGQEVVLDGTSAPVVSSARASGEESLVDSEREAAGNEQALRGLGELRAKKPGSDKELDRGVRLTRHDVKVRIAGAMARTEIDETFTNDTDDELEGIYRFPVPPGAQIERLALEVDGKLLDGSFVEKGKASGIWKGVIRNATKVSDTPKDDIVWVPGPWRDPALLEWQRGGRAELRIFPIPKRGARRIVIAYTENVELSGGSRRYVHALPRATASDLTIDKFSIDAKVLGRNPDTAVRIRGYELAPEGEDRWTMGADKFLPTGDLVIDFVPKDAKSEVTAWAYRDEKGATADAGTAHVGGGDPYVALSLRPRLPSLRGERPREQVIAVDVGRSMVGERHNRATKIAAAMVRDMDRRDRVTVMACDLECRVIPGGWMTPGSDAADKASRFLTSVATEGASDPVGMVRQAARVGGREPNHDLRVTLISGGVAGAGYRSPARVAPAVRDALGSREASVVAIPIGADADTKLLEEVARGGGGVVVPYRPGERANQTSMQALAATYGAALRDVELELPEGLERRAPSALLPIRPGGETLVAARMTRPVVNGDMVLRGSIGGEKFEARYPLTVEAVADDRNAFAARLYAAFRIADKEREGDSTKAELVTLSQRFSVPSRHTSLIVLESEAMFRAFGIDRTVHAPSWNAEGMGASTESANPNAPPSGRGSEDEAAYSGGGESAPAAPPAVALKSAPAPTMSPRATTVSPDIGGGVPGGRTIRRAPMDIDEEFNPRRGGPAFVPMRRVWNRVAEVTPAARALDLTDKLRSAEALVKASPDQRKLYLDHARLLSLAGDMESLQRSLEGWVAKDPVDAEVTTLRAEVLARSGKREESLRVLSGVANLTTDVAILRALATAYERAGKAAHACALRVAVAESAPNDARAAAEAARCERALGHAALADKWLEQKGAREEAARLDKTNAGSEKPGGDIVVEATWDAPVDLDLAIIEPGGTRASWVGRGRANVADAQSTSRETLGITNRKPGRFIVEIVRARGSETQPVSGSLRITSGGQMRIVPFKLDGVRAEVAHVNARYVPTLVPLQPAPW